MHSRDGSGRGFTVTHLSPAQLTLVVRQRHETRVLLVLALLSFHHLLPVRQCQQIVLRHVRGTSAGEPGETLRGAPRGVDVVWVHPAGGTEPLSLDMRRRQHTDLRQRGQRRLETAPVERPVADVAHDGVLRVTDVLKRQQNRSPCDRRSTPRSSHPCW